MYIFHDTYELRKPNLESKGAAYKAIPLSAKMREKEQESISDEEALIRLRRFNRSRKNR